MKEEILGLLLELTKNNKIVWNIRKQKLHAEFGEYEIKIKDCKGDGKIVKISNSNAKIRFFKDTSLPKEYALIEEIEILALEQAYETEKAKETFFIPEFLDVLKLKATK
jgi:hypothetical protein